MVFTTILFLSFIYQSFQFCSTSCQYNPKKPNQFSAEGASYIVHSLWTWAKFIWHCITTQLTLIEIAEKKALCLLIVCFFKNVFLFLSSMFCRFHCQEFSPACLNLFLGPLLFFAAIVNGIAFLHLELISYWCTEVLLIFVC